MAIFNNDLSLHITAIEHEEIMESIYERTRRQNKEMSVKTGIATGAIVASSTISLNQGHPEILLATLGVLVVSNTLYNLYIKNKHLKPYKVDYSDIKNIDYRKLAKEQRERARYEGKLTFTSPYRYELENKEEIEEEFGHPGDNELPVHFLEQELVPSRVLHEYELYSKRYQVPTLTITEEELTIFVNKFSELLKKVNMSHRIYHYTSEYFKRLITKGIINYWDEITLDTLLNELDIFLGIDLAQEDIEEFRQSYKPVENTKKLK